MALGELFVALVVLGTSTPASAKDARQAGSPRVVVSGVDLLGPGGAALSRESVQAAFERGLAAAGLEVLGHGRIQGALERHPELRGCQSLACRAKLGRILEAPLCARARLGGDQRQIHVTVSLYRCHEEAPLSSMTRQCRAGTGVQAEEAVARLGEEVAKAAFRKLAGAQVRPVDGSGSSPGMGTGPLAVDSAWHRRPLFVSGVTLASVGLVSTLAGSVLWALHGRTYRDQGDMAQVYRTQVGGITATSLGLGALLAGAAMAILAWRQAPGHRQALEPQARGPRALGVSFDPRRGMLGVWGEF